jgi:integrase/recombinase XerD
MASRFIDWLNMNGYLSSNSFNELRGQYGGRLAPIVRALLSQEPKAALEKLRPLPVFASPLGPLMREHLEMIRSLGYRSEHAEGQLRRFDRFLQVRPDLIGKPLPQLIEAWRQAGTSLHHALEAQQCGRILSKVQARHDPTAAIIPSDPQCCDDGEHHIAAPTFTQNRKWPICWRTHGSFPRAFIRFGHGPPTPYCC